jgi:hypothetical protein
MGFAIQTLMQAARTEDFLQRAFCDHAGSVPGATVEPM